jgi:hypothetical protein
MFKWLKRRKEHRKKILEYHRLLVRLGDDEVLSDAWYYKSSSKGLRYWIDNKAELLKKYSEEYYNNEVEKRKTDCEYHRSKYVDTKTKMETLRFDLFGT